ncbi:hypothetical protein C8R46DRAFT_1354129 [Mycena filopes]|nr:hypothetical protein C8R46DRAFT_1354129 [Mycena filopes]
MGLLPLSRHCPDLQSIALAIDATSIRMDDPARNPRMLQTALTVADFLSSVFPALANLSGREGATARRWKQVSKLMPSYAATRADERRFGAVNDLA